MKTENVTGLFLLDVVTHSATEGARNAQSALRWLSAGVGAAIGLTVTWMGSHQPKHPELAVTALALLLLCFVPAVVGEWLAMPLLALKDSGKNGRDAFKALQDEAAKRSNTAEVDFARVGLELEGVMPRRLWCAFGSHAFTPDGAFVMARWIGGRINALRMCARIMVTLAPICGAILIFALIDPRIR